MYRSAVNVRNAHGQTAYTARFYHLHVPFLRRHQETHGNKNICLRVNGKLYRQFQRNTFINDDRLKYVWLNLLWCTMYLNDSSHITTVDCREITRIIYQKTRVSNVKYVRFYLYTERIFFFNDFWFSMTSSWIFESRVSNYLTNAI